MLIQPSKSISHANQARKCHQEKPSISKKETQRLKTRAIKKAQAHQIASPELSARSQKCEFKKKQNNAFV